MKISDLCQMTKLGLLDFERAVGGGYVMRGQRYSQADVETMLYNIGWRGRRSDDVVAAMEKTAKFARAVTRYIDDDEILAADAQFESMRITDSVKIVDRVVIAFGGGSHLTIVHGARDASGYALYNPARSISQPVEKFRSLKSALEYINLM